MGGCLEKPDVERPASSLPPPAGKLGAPQVLERSSYDAQLRAHLQAHAMPQTNGRPVLTAARFLAKARHAHAVVEKRRADGCGGAAAHLPSATAAEARQVAARGKFSREEKIEDGLALLRARVANVGVAVVYMKDDGNCQFRSLAQELYGDQELHTTVRQTVLRYMKEHADEFSFYVGEAAEWRQYLKRMGGLRTWGDELTLRAAADAFGVVIHVVSTEHENWLLHYVSSSLHGKIPEDGPPPAGTCELFLSYVSPIHYNIIATLEMVSESGPLAESSMGRGVCGGMGL
jgi:hypothetical protein